MKKTNKLEYSGENIIGVKHPFDLKNPVHLVKNKCSLIFDQQLLLAKGVKNAPHFRSLTLGLVALIDRFEPDTKSIQYNRLRDMCVKLLQELGAAYCAAPCNPNMGDNLDILSDEVEIISMYVLKLIKLKR